MRIGEYASAAFHETLRINGKLRPASLGFPFICAPFDVQDCCPLNRDGLQAVVRWHPDFMALEGPWTAFD